MFVSIHIPKTAGTSLAYVFDHGSGRRILYDYADDYSNAVMDDAAFWERHKPFVERRFDFIHGHFHYRKYAEVFPDADYLVCLRHPVDRIISQYHHVLAEQNTLDWQYRAIVEHGLDAADFATLDGVGDAQAVHVAGRDIADYAFVFLAEHLDQSVRAFQNRFTFGRHDPMMRGTEADGGLPRMNVRSGQPEVPRIVQEKIYEVATPDVELYVRGSEIAEGLVRRYV